MLWKLSSKARIASDFSTLLRIKQGEKRIRCLPKSDFRLWQATYFSTSEPAIIWKLVTCQRITSKRYSTSMSRHLSPRYGQVILVSGYTVLAVVNWSQHWCTRCVQYQFSCATKLARKCEIEHWFSCGADGRAGCERCTVTWLPNFLGWVDLLTHGAPQARFVRQSSAKKVLKRYRMVRCQVLVIVIEHFVLLAWVTGRSC